MFHGSLPVGVRLNGNSMENMQFLVGKYFLNWMRIILKWNTRQRRLMWSACRLLEWNLAVEFFRR